MTDTGTSPGAEESPGAETATAHDGLEPSTRLVLAVADRTGNSIEELPVLHETIDPEALDRLAADEEAASVEVRFEYAGFDVTVTGDGTIELIRADS